MKIFHPFRAHHAMRSVLALTIAACTASAHAQLRVPGIDLPLPQRIGPLDTGILRDPAERLLSDRTVQDVRGLRLGEITRRLRQHRDVLEADPRGEPVVRREILAWSPNAASLAAAKAAGLGIARERRLEGLDETVVTFRVPDGTDTATALELLRQRDPEGTYDFNHVYTGSAAAPMVAATPARKHGRAAPGTVSVGLVDGGVDTAHPVFADTPVRRWGCDEVAHPDPHGTAVAALMVGKSADFRGVAPGASLFAADIYCDSGSGGSAERIAGALAWLARQQVGVINMSIVGPANLALERAVGAMIRRGHLLVAAAGNDGPAAPPLYPASYPGVVGVGAVDKRGRILPEAARGPQVMFSAPGSNMVSASPGSPPYRQVRGTSFAAPIVAAMLAAALPAPDKAAAADALSALARRASNGIVGMDFRTDPSALK